MRDRPLARRLIPGIARTTWRAVATVREASPRGFAWALALQLVGAVAATAVVVTGKFAIDAVVAAGGASAPAATDVAGLVAPLVGLAAATALSSGVATWQVQQMRLLAEDTDVLAWRRLTGVTARVPFDVADRPDFVDVVERLQDHALGRPMQMASAALAAVGSVLTGVSLAVAVLVLGPVLLPVLLLAGVPILVLARVAARSEVRFAHAWSEVWRRRDDVRAMLSEPDFAKELRAFELGPAMRRRHEDLASRFRAVLGRQVRHRQVLALLGGVVNGAALAVTLVLVVVLLARGELSLARAGAAVIAVRLLNAQLDRLFGALSELVESAPFLDEFDEFCGTSTHETVAAPPPGPCPAAGLQLRDVRYRYPGTDRDVLRGVDLDLRPGRLVVLVGENGSGKSTLALVAGGLLAPASGSVLWEGRPLSHSEHLGLRTVASPVFQDFVEYDLTFAENVDPAADPARLRSGGADRDRVCEATRRAGLTARVAALPQGLDTQLGRSFAGGVDLSGGQWQRVALARALARPARVLVLDEPSSALDPHQEARLFEDLRALRDRYAVLLVSHRYANLHLADDIYVLDGGVVAEHGTHEDLMAASGIYAGLYRRQAGGYDAAASLSSSSSTTVARNGGPHGRSAT